MFKFLIAVLVLLTATPANASDAYFEYAIYGGGFRVVNATLDITENSNDYNLISTAKTAGFLGRLAPWSSVMKSQGRVHDNNWLPQYFENTTIWRDDAKTTILEYDQTGTINNRLVKEQGRDDDNTPADPELAKGAIDLPTGILNFFRHRDAEQGCEGKFAVYDGKRRYLVALANQETKPLTSNKYNSFSGDAISCTIEVIQDGGKWSSKNRGWFRIQEESRELGRLPRIYLSPVNDISWLVPVRMDLASPYGSFIMHLTKIGR